MALFVQIDHFRKTDQKPTVKNHLFSISWFRSFNRTSFQQQLKPMVSGRLSNAFALQSYILSTTTETWAWARQVLRLPSLQSYILSTTTETSRRLYVTLRVFSFNRTSFQQQLKQWDVKAFYEDLRLQSYILSTTTETSYSARQQNAPNCFNRTSFQQQLKLSCRCFMR